MIEDVVYMLASLQLPEYPVYHYRKSTRLGCYELDSSIPFSRFLSFVLPHRDHYLMFRHTDDQGL